MRLWAVDATLPVIVQRLAVLVTLGLLGWAGLASYNFIPGWVMSLQLDSAAEGARAKE